MPAYDREKILRHFENWLDQVLRDETPPDGVAMELLAALDGSDAGNDDAGEDAYSVREALTVAAQEVKLQSRSFRQLSETLEPLATLPERLEPALRLGEDAVEEVRRQAESQAREDTLDLLLDLRDRLCRGSDAAARSLRQMRETPPPNWLSRLTPGRESVLRHAAESAAAVEHANRLTLDFLDEALAAMNVREIDCLNRPFDPTRMSAVEIEETGRLPDGTVSEVFRRGYEQRGKICRVAQVKVTRSPSAAAGGDGNE
jgi:hypothetical protein